MKTPKNLQLEQELKESLELLRPVPPRDAQEAARNRTLFLAEAASIRESRPAIVPVSVSTEAEKRHKVWIDKITQVFRRKELFPMLHPLIAVLVSLSLIFSGAGVVTAAAQDSLPNDFLYPVKLISEDIRLAFTTSAQTKLSLEQEFSNRRVKEMVILSERGQPIPEKVANRFREELDDALNLAAGMDELAMNQALERVRANIRQQTQLMSKVAQSTDPVLEQARLCIQEQLRMAEMGLVDPQGFKEQVRERKHNRQNQPENLPQPPISPEPVGPGSQRTPSPREGNSPGPRAGTQTGTPVQDGSGSGPGSRPMESSLTPESGQSNGPDPRQPSATPDQGGGYGSGSEATCICTPVQDGSVPGSGSGPMEPSHTPMQDGKGGGNGGSGRNP
jgi:protein-tyrosine-phosphatase